MFQDEIDVRLPDPHANLGGFAVVFSGVPAAAFVNDDFRGSRKEEIAGVWVRHNLLKVLQGNVFIDLDYFYGVLMSKHFGMVMVFEIFPDWFWRNRAHLDDEVLDILVLPAHVKITMQGVNPSPFG